MLKNLRLQDNNPPGLPPRLAYIGRGTNTTVAIWTQEHDTGGLTTRTTALTSGLTPHSMHWDGYYFYATAKSTTALEMARSTDGITWNLVLDASINGDTYQPRNLIHNPNSDERWLFTDGPSTNAIYYYKSTDGGATWGTQQSKTITNMTGALLTSAVYDPGLSTDGGFFIVTGGTANPQIQYAWDFTELDRIPVSGFTNLHVWGVNYEAGSLYGGMAEEPQDSTFRWTDHALTGTNNNINMPVGSVYTFNYINGYCEDTLLYVTNLTGLAQHTLRTINSSKSLGSNHVWNPGSNVVLNLPRYGCARGDYVAMFHPSTNGAAKVRLSRNGASTFTDYTVPDTTSASSHGVYDGIG